MGTASSPRVAVVLPGQGSQRPGAGLAWVDTPAWSVLAAAGPEVAHLLLAADADELRQTRAAQLSVLAADLLAWSALVGSGALDGVKVVGVAGHSLGEYAALVAAGVLSVADAFRLVDVRGRAMQAAADAAPGAMTAVLGLPVEAASAVCADARADGLELWVANDNGPRQVVVSGRPAAVEAGGERLRAAGARRLLPLPVGGAFHTPLMEPARAPLVSALGSVAWGPGRWPVLSSVDAAAHGDGWAYRLAGQLTATVRWRETAQALADAGATVLLECGPGGVLTGLARQALPEVTALRVDSPAAVAAASLLLR